MPRRTFTVCYLDLVGRSASLLYDHICHRHFWSIYAGDGSATQSSALRRLTRGTSDAGSNESAVLVDESKVALYVAPSANDA